MIVTPQLRIARINPAFTCITGFAPEEVIGRSPNVLSSSAHGRDFYQQMWASIQQDGYWHGEIWNRRKSGESFAELLSISVARNASGEVEQYIGVFSDISQIKVHKAALDRITHFDLLTGLPNRRLLTDRFRQGMMRSEHTGKFLAVCSLDLDGFKQINDNFGSASGDALLIGVAENLKMALRGDETLTRMGG